MNSLYRLFLCVVMQRVYLDGIVTLFDQKDSAFSQFSACPLRVAPDIAVDRKVTSAGCAEQRIERFFRHLPDHIPHRHFNRAGGPGVIHVQMRRVCLRYQIPQPPRGDRIQRGDAWCDGVDDAGNVRFMPIQHIALTPALNPVMAGEANKQARFDITKAMVALRGSGNPGFNPGNIKGGKFGCNGTARKIL